MLVYPKTSFDIPLETLSTNIIGTANLLESIRQTKEKSDNYDPVVHVCSSSEVYGKSEKGRNFLNQPSMDLVLIQ